MPPENNANELDCVNVVQLTDSHLFADPDTRLPGFLVPRLVREVAGENGKVPLPVELMD